MEIISYQEITPVLNATHFMASGVKLIGSVEMGDHVNIWFNTVARGDVNKITIGQNTNIQDLSMLHVTSEHPLIIGENVTVGHSCILHGCTIGKSSLIGMGAKVLDGAVIGERCLVAAGSVVPPGKTYPDGVMIMGAPAKVIRELSESEIQNISNHYLSYLDTAKAYMDG